MCAQSVKVCQYCQREVNTTTNRLIQELCGHNKCRRCLIEEADECRICLEENAEKSLELPKPAAVPALPCKLKTAWAQMVTAAKEFDESGEQESEKGDKSMDSDAWMIDTEAEDDVEEPCVQEDQEKATETAGKAKEHKPKAKFVLPGHVRKVDEKKFECTICARQFSSRQQCVYHSYCDPALKKPHECPHCCQGFVTLQHLQYHLQSHEETTLKCSLCSKTFIRTQSLQKHLKIHRAEHEHQCTRCERSFPFRFQLRQHELKHENARPHQCGICERAFALKENLKKHLLVHTKEKRFHCDVCGRGFTRSTTLKAHQNTHSKKRLVGPCSTCGKTFVDARSFARHASSHSTTLSFTCSICRAHFRRKDNLRRHVKVIHPEENLLETLRESQREVETDAAPPPPRTCSVIKFTGNAKPPSAVEAVDTQEEPQDVPQVRESPAKVPQVDERPPKPKKPFDPLEIYRKILCPSRDDDDDEPPEPNPTPPVPPIVRKTSQEGNFVHWRKRTSLNFTQNARRKD